MDQKNVPICLVPPSPEDVPFLLDLGEGMASLTGLVSLISFSGIFIYPCDRLSLIQYDKFQGGTNLFT